MSHPIILPDTYILEIRTILGHGCLSIFFPMSGVEKLHKQPLPEAAVICIMQVSSTII